MPELCIRESLQSKVLLPIYLILFVHLSIFHNLSIIFYLPNFTRCVVVETLPKPGPAAQDFTAEAPQLQCSITSWRPHHPPWRGARGMATSLRRYDVLSPAGL